MSTDHKRACPQSATPLAHPARSTRWVCRQANQNPEDSGSRAANTFYRRVGDWASQTNRITIKTGPSRKH
jgi:hypothetical protein